MSENKPPVDLNIMFNNALQALIMNIGDISRAWNMARQIDAEQKQVITQLQNGLRDLQARYDKEVTKKK